jgi:hypothetical protein
LDGAAHEMVVKVDAGLGLRVDHRKGYLARAVEK